VADVGCWMLDVGCQQIVIPTSSVSRAGLIEPESDIGRVWVYPKSNIKYPISKIRSV
jgi:hypothetical protein